MENTEIKDEPVSFDDLILTDDIIDIKAHICVSIPIQ